MTNAVSAIAACVDEFDSTIPTALLDELLICIAKGPTGGETPADSVAANPSSASIPSYMCAYNVIKRCEDRLSTPIANLLNGLLNNDTRYMSETQINQEAVWGIVFEIHRIAPNILTTVIGNVAGALNVEDVERRLRVVKLLGRLFYSETSDCGSKFASVYRSWSERVTDTDPTVRKQMARCLVKILENKESLRTAATASLVTMLSDPVSDIRIEVVHNVCDLASTDPNSISEELLIEVGKRVSSKSKTERKDAATGLAQIYQTHYTKPKLEQINGNEDCDIDTIIVTALNLEVDGANSAHKSLEWIPKVLFESLCYSDAVDTDMRSRIIQIVDDVLLPKSLSTTARATGISMVVSMLDDMNSNAMKWFSVFLQDRARAQAQLNLYLDTREESRKHKVNSSEYVTLNAEAENHLELLVNEFAPLVIAGGNEDKKKSDIMSKIHNHKDNHIFKLLASIGDCNHTVTARARALEELPKRVMSLGTNAAQWMKTLVRRCAMGASINFEIISHCSMFAQEAAREDEWPACSLFLDIVKIATTAFPDMGKGNDGECFNTLTEFFGECRNLQGKSKKDAESNGIMGRLSNILAQIAPAASTLDNTNNATGAKQSKKEVEAEAGRAASLQEELLRMCVKDGSPEEARNAVVVMAATVGKGKSEMEAFSPLLKALTAPQRLSVDNDRCVSVLTALAALAEKAPVAFEGGGGGGEEGRGVKAVRFALESVLLGKRGASILGSSGDDDVEMSDASDSEEGAPKKSAAAKAAAEKQLATSRAVAAIQLLVAHIRSLPAISKTQRSQMKQLLDSGNTDISFPTHTKTVFDTLLRIVEEKGMLPSARDRKICTDAKSKAAIRKAAGVGLLQLCESSKQRELFLDVRGWHILSQVLSDSDASVRGACVDELSCMLTGGGSFKKGMAPSLRFLALGCFGADGDGVPGNVSAANGGACNLGKQSGALKASTTDSVKNLRITCDATMAQCKAMGPTGEARFENVFKPMVMPEFALAYALHLLALRKESPKAKKPVGDKGEIDGSYKMLLKRLRWILEPLVSSLGDHANNISFLIKITEQVGNSFDAVVPNNETESDFADMNEEDGRARLTTVCTAARDVLLNFVKTDDNLAPYPGNIQIPVDLFKQREGAQVTKFKKMGKADYAKERKRVAAEADMYEADMYEDDGGFNYIGDDVDLEPSRHEESRDEMPPMNDVSATSQAADLIASPMAVKPPRKTNWGLSPISSPLKGKAAPSPKRRVSTMPKVKEAKEVVPKVNVKVDRSLSQSSSAASLKKSPANTKGAKRKSAGKTTKAQDESLDFDDMVDQENDAGNKAKKGRKSNDAAKPAAAKKAGKQSAGRAASKA
jgi:hypothetical protein